MPHQADHRIIWKAVSPHFLLWKRWEDTFVVYERRSGTTHYLNEVCHDLVTEVLAKPRSVDQVAAIMSGTNRVLADSNYKNETEQLLMRLEQIGLVEGK